MSGPRIQQRTRIYLGCEGESEQSYGKRLNEIADAAGLSLFLDCDVLGGGDPLALIQLATVRIREKSKKRGAFAYRAVFLDRDRVGQTTERDQKIPTLVDRHRIQLIWQDPCHEALLLRHLPGQTFMRPQTSGLAAEALERLWPGYKKGMPASELAARIDRTAVERAASVEADLMSLLRAIGLAGEA